MLLKQQIYTSPFSIGVVIIDDHPEVTVVEDSQSNLNDDGFTEVVSKKQQKRLQDEERRKKEEQTVQVQDHHLYWERAPCSTGNVVKCVESSFQISCIFHLINITR